MKTLVSIIAAGIILASCGSNTDKQAQISAQQKTVDSLKTEMVKKQTIDSMNAAVAAQQQQAAINNEQQRVVSSHHASHRAPAHNSYSTSNTYYGSAPTPAQAPAPAVQETHKKGWSAKAKGALIGTGVGAITGAMVDKKKGEGAVVGGAAGAVLGLGAGAIIDKKNKDKDK